MRTAHLDLERMQTQDPGLYQVYLQNQELANAPQIGPDRERYRNVRIAVLRLPTEIPAQHFVAENPLPVVNIPSLQARPEVQNAVSDISRAMAETNPSLNMENLLNQH